MTVPNGMLLCPIDIRDSPSVAIAQRTFEKYYNGWSGSGCRAGRADYAHAEPNISQKLYLTLSIVTDRNFRAVRNKDDSLGHPQLNALVMLKFLP